MAVINAVSSVTFESASSMDSRLVFRLSIIAVSLLLSGNSIVFAEEASAASASPTSHSEANHDAHGGHDTSVPLSWKTDLALFSLITFLLFVFVLGKFAWGPMIQGLDTREAGIRKAISDAEENRRKSEALLTEYEQKLRQAEQTVAQMVAEARRDAERTSSDLISNAQKEVGAIRDRAKDEIRQAKDTALADVFTQINSKVILATEHVLGRALQEDDQERLIGQALAEISG